jgi:pyochelin biosynthetic protein PchC
MTGKTGGDWVRRFHPLPDAPARLVCLPHAGGSANYFFPVSRALSSKLDVLCVQYPGRQDRRREPCVGTIHELADSIVDVLRPWADRPVAFFGHSMGAIIAFEVALRLEAEGISPAVLFLSGRRAPSTFRLETNHLLPDKDLVQELRGMQGTDASLLDDDDIVDMILPSLRSDYRAVETYDNREAGAVDCPIVACNGDKDAMVTPEEARAWENHTNAGFDSRTYRGGHFYLSDHAASLITLIADKVETVVRKPAAA